MPSSYNLPEIVKKEIDELVRSGYYSSKSDVVKDALRFMLDNKKNLRLAAAIGLYRNGQITLGKAAEIAGVGMIEFKDHLKEYGVRRAIKSENAAKMDRAIEKMKARHG